MYRTTVVLLLGAAAAACAPAGPAGPGSAARPVYRPVSPALPAIPSVDGPLAIRVVHPTPGSSRPAVDSTFIYGSVGTGRAGLTINGAAVPVAPNGAFLAYLPMPADGTWRLRAEAGGQVRTEEVAYRAPGGAAPAPAPATGPAAATYSPARLGTVTGGADTLATGSDAVFLRPTPTGTYQWFLPRGARLAVEERRGDQYRVRLGANTEAWIAASALALADAAAPPPAEAIGPVTVRAAAGGYDLRAPAAFRPFLVEASDSAVTVTVYWTGGDAGRVDAPGDGYVRGASSRPLGTATQYVVRTAAPVWGYRAWYAADGTLVVRLRRPPAIDAGDPLRGRRIVLDPGHPPAGATGPTGLYEGDANLAIALPLAEKLRARGAEVILTRTTREPLASATDAGAELRARVNLAVERGGELLVSIHNNAFGEGANPWRMHGTSTYWFHPFARPLAAALQREIQRETGIRDIGAVQGNLALARPTWLPSVLTESLFMPIPEQEEALRDPVFLDRLANAHLRGIEAFLRERAEPR